jgi:hypothetical protein
VSPWFAAPNEVSATETGGGGDLFAAPDKNPAKNFCAKKFAGRE